MKIKQESITLLTNKLIANNFSFLGVIDENELDYFEEVNDYKIGIMSAENMIIILVNQMGWGIDGNDQDWDNAKKILEE
jgi:hypothetical protein